MLWRSGQQLPQLLAFLWALPAIAQGPLVTAQGDVAVIQDDGSILGHANPFNLDGSSLRFTPQASGGYKVEQIPSVWDADFGNQIIWDGTSDPGSKQINFAALTFPFGGSLWNSAVMNSTGDLTFGWREDAIVCPRYFLFDNLASTLLSSGLPSIVPLWHRFSVSTATETVQPAARAATTSINQAYSKEVAGKAVFTWVTSDYFLNPQAFITAPDSNSFQVAISSDGTILLSWNGVATQEGVTGVFPGYQPYSQPKLISTNSNAIATPNIPAYLQIMDGRIEQIDDLNLRFTLDMKGAIPASSPGLAYRIYIDTTAPFQAGILPFSNAVCVALLSPDGNGGWTASLYSLTSSPLCAGATLSSVSGNSLSMVVPGQTFSSRRISHGLPML